MQFNDLGQCTLRDWQLVGDFGQDPISLILCSVTKIFDFLVVILFQRLQQGFDMNNFETFNVGASRKPSILSDQCSIFCLLQYLQYILIPQ